MNHLSFKQASFFLSRTRNDLVNTTKTCECNGESLITTRQNFVGNVDCKTVVFFANASDSKYSNERSGASLKAARENGERC